ncbi:hypothetical protein LT989_01880 [Citrobacter portucalensis]|uniref:hypothetical protein n=1 Tax=Citrobacter portucalensis TaxID=1639133 RepID=UPI001E596438|nr:hypothetical protein [Citrobacter portucalensis]UHD37472.1 hypothetical protein LT989_01880 [Citrobacter portucalensis]
MAINNFKPFATAANANVMSQADWEGLPALLSGFTSGKAASAEVNKAIRQASFIAAALAQYTANKSGLDVLDDGDLNGFIAKMSAAFGKDFQALDATLTALAGLTTGANKLPYFTGTDTASQTDLTSVGRDIIGKGTIADILTYLGITQALALKAPLASPSFSGTPSVPTAGQAEIDFRIANTAFVAQAIADLNGGAPAVLNTLKKLASAINNDANFYSTVNSALGPKASLSDFTSSKTSTSVVGNQPGGLRFMCGYITVPTDSNGNIFITLPDTFLGGVVYCEAHQCGSSYVGDNSPFVFSSYQPASGPTSSISFAVRATTTGAPLINDSIQLMYFVRGY